MTWWYENEEEEMKVYKDPKMCEKCKAEFFSKPYDHRDATPGQIGYCVHCDNCLIKDKEKEMEFDKSRVYTAVNADELRAGDKVIVAMSLATMKKYFESGNIDERITTLKDVLCDSFIHRFVTEQSSYPLAYLVERENNCTNCGNTDCPNCEHKDEYRKTLKCMKYKPKTEKHYRPFRDTEELIAKWWELDGWSKREAQYKKDKLRMPLIWIKHKYNLCHQASLITGYFDNQIIVSGEKIESMEMLYADWVFPDGSVCGVEE